jgi:hypothetical protein
MKKLKNIMVTIVLLFSLLGLPTKDSANEPEITQPPTPTFEQEISRIFKDKSNIALAVFEHESNGGDIDAKNYNCRYNGKSTFCKKGDEKKAWSVDCGKAQINVKGQVCPPELMTDEGQIKAIERIYKEQGLNAWVSYKSGAYKKFL